MRIVVEPEEGHELDRLVTALLSATGVVHRAIDDTPRPQRAEGLEIVAVVADRLRDSLALLAELVTRSSPSRPRSSRRRR